MVGRAPALTVVLIAGLVIAGVLLWYDRLGAGPRSLEHTAGGVEPAAGALIDGSAPAVAPPHEAATPQPPAEGERVVVEATPDAPALLRVVGKVVNAEDAPVPGATLWLSEPDSTTEGAVAGQADAAGTFALERVRAPACLWAWAPGWAPSTPALVLDDSDVGIEVRLRLSVRGMTVRGLVVDPAEHPIAGAEVWVGSRFEQGDELRSLMGRKREDRSGWASSIRPPPLRYVTDDQGRFETTHATAMAKLFVFAQADGFAVGHEALFIQPGGSADVRIRLQPSCAVAGTIVDDAGSARAGITVQARPRLIKGPPWYATAAETDAEGRYRVERIAPGDLEITAEHAQWGRASGRITVAVEQEAHWDARLDKGLRIRGRLVAESGEPLPDVGASAYTPGSTPIPAPRPTTTDLDGRFELIRCGDASYRLHLVEKVSWIGSSLVYVPDIRPGPEEHLFVVPWRKIPSSFLTGELRDDRGPVQEAKIGLAWGAEDGGGKSIGAHAVNSPFRIGPLPAGRYIARFSREGGPFLETAPFDLQPRTTVDLGVLWFERFASLTVSVRDAAGAPVAAQAQLEHLVTGDVERAAADESAGPVVLKQLRPGPYTLRVLAAGHPPVTQPVSLGSGQELHLEQPVATGVEVTFRLPGIYGAGVTLRWQTDGGETMFVEDVRDRQRRELVLQRRFLPGRYVLVVEGHRAAPLLRRVTKDSPAEKPIAECRFDVAEGSKGEVVTLPR